MNILAEEDWRGQWSAIDLDTYDGAEDSRSPVGLGRTREQAIADLEDKLWDIGAPL